MIKTAIISSSAISDAGRMDAGFHILQKSHEKRIADLLQVMDKDMALDTARTMFEAIPAKHRKLLAPLLRGSEVRSPSNEALAKAADEYPYIAIAVFEAARNEIKTDIDAEIKEAKANAAKLEKRLETVDKLLNATRDSTQ